MVGRFHREEDAHIDPLEHILSCFLFLRGTDPDRRAPLLRAQKKSGKVKVAPYQGEYIFGMVTFSSFERCPKSIPQYRPSGKLRKDEHELLCEPQTRSRYARCYGSRDWFPPETREIAVAICHWAHIIENAEQQPTQISMRTAAFCTTHNPMHETFVRRCTQKGSSRSRSKHLG